MKKEKVPDQPKTIHMKTGQLGEKIASRWQQIHYPRLVSSVREAAHHQAAKRTKTTQNEASWATSGTSLQTPLYLTLGHYPQLDPGRYPCEKQPEWRLMDGRSRSSVASAAGWALIQNGRCLKEREVMETARGEGEGQLREDVHHYCLGDW